MERLSQVPRRYVIAGLAIVIEISLAIVWLFVRDARKAAAPAT
jgi:hypothetical protein